MPVQPTAAEVQKIWDIAGPSADAFVASSDGLAAQVASCRTVYEELKKSQQAIEAVLTAGNYPPCADLAAATARYKAEVSSLPALVNAYAANYTLLDPAIKAGLASSADIKKLERQLSPQSSNGRTSKSPRAFARSTSDFRGSSRMFGISRRRNRRRC